METNVFYIHLFKCAGNAVFAPVQFYYREEKIRPWYNFNIPPEHSWYWDKLTEDERQAVWFFFGHFRNGNTFERLRRISYTRPPQFFTVLRDPIERVISSYYYDRLDKCAKDPLHKYFKKYSLEECLDPKIFSTFEERDKFFWLEILQDHQTRILSGLPHTINIPLDHYVSVDTQHLLQAQNHLCFFALVGFTETLYDDWNKYYSPLLRDVEIPSHLQKDHANVTPDKPIVSQSVRDKIASYNHFDLALYEWAKSQRIGF